MVTLESLTLTTRVLYPLEAGAYPNIEDLNGSSPLYLAVNNGHHDIVSILCENGAKVNARGFGNNSPLHVAVKEGHDKCTETLIQHKANVNVRDSSGCTPLTLAVKHKQYTALDSLLSAGADVNIQDHQGRTCLHYSCHNALAVGLDRLLLAGASVNIQDKQGCTPLMFAASEGLEKVVKKLCNVSGCDPNICNNSVRKRPIHLLAYKGHAGSVQDLIDCGADMNALDIDDKSPMYYAVLNNKKDVVAALLRANGCLEQFKYCGQSTPANCPGSTAVKSNNTHILRMFIHTGYDQNHTIQEQKLHDFSNNNEMRELLYDATRIHSLRHMTRLLVRDCLIPCSFDSIQQLPLPLKMKDYLNFQDLTDLK